MYWSLLSTGVYWSVLESTVYWSLLESTVYWSVLESTVKGSQVAERLGNQASNQTVAGSIPGLKNYIVSLGKALHPTCLGECPCIC